MTRPGIWPVSRHRSTRAAVHSSGLTLRPLPIFTAAAGLTASMCGTRSASEDEATAITRLIRASVSGRVEYRRPSRWPGRRAGAAAGRSGPRRPRAG